MGLEGSATRVLSAFVLSVAITAGLVVGGPAVTAEPPTDLSAVGSGVPEPTPNVTQDGRPPADTGPFPRFEDVSSAVGFQYEPNVPAGFEEANSGIYVADVTGNGYEDLLAVGEEHPVLFRNTGGAYVNYRTFEQPLVQTAHFFDQDADGDPDLVLAQYAGELVFYENRRGRFVRTAVGLDAAVSNPSSIVSADFTGNGCLDLFVTQYGLWSRTTPLTLAEARQVRERPGLRPESRNGKPNRLFYGNCSTFDSVAGAAGIGGERWSLVATATDLTGDGYPDIHVGNDWGSDYLYVNRHNGTFDRRRMGPASDRNAMSSTAFDMDGDLDLDLFVTNIYYPDNRTRTERAPPLHRDAALPEGNNYFLNDGTGNFTDRAPKHGLERGGWGWTATIGDFNNDGHPDIVQTTESVYWIEPYSGVYDSLQVWTGTRDSWTKLDGREYGLDQENTYSIASLDYDNDGHLDVAVGTAPLGPNLRGKAQPFELYRNQQDGRSYLQLFVRDPDAIETGASVHIETNERTVYRKLTSGGNYQTQDSSLVHVGLGNERLERVVVAWPDGNRTVYTGLEPGNRYVLEPTGVEPVR